MISMILQCSFQGAVFDCNTVWCIAFQHLHSRTMLGEPARSPGWPPAAFIGAVLDCNIVWCIAV